MGATHPSHPTVLHFTSIMMYGVEHVLRISRSFNLLQLVVAFFLLGPKIPPVTSAILKRFVYFA